MYGHEADAHLFPFILVPVILDSIHFKILPGVKPRLNTNNPNENA